MAILRLLGFIAVPLWLSSPCAAEGAIAFGSDNNGRMYVGVSWNKSTFGDAQTAALTRCQNHGSSCSIHRTFAGVCFALTLGTGKGAKYHWVTRRTQPEAESAALTRCQEAGGACELKTSGCDMASGGTPSQPPTPPIQEPSRSPNPPSSSPAPSDACRRYPNLC